MASEKAVYWMALSVLALAAVNGLVSEYRGWAGRLADKSIAMVEEASEIATGYADPATLGRMNMGRMNVVQTNDELGRLVCAQVRLARVQTRLPLHQAEMIRAQVDAIRVQMLNQKMLDQRMLDQRIRAAIAAHTQPNIVIDVPEPPEPAQIVEHATF
jgi:ribosomal protein L16 Arg81 hydroxylase